MLWSGKGKTKAKELSISIVSILDSQCISFMLVKTFRRNLQTYFDIYLDDKKDRIRS